MRSGIFISFLFLVTAFSLSGQQKLSSLKSGADNGSILTTSDTTENVDVVPVSLSSEKMGLPLDNSISPLKTQPSQPKNTATKKTEPAKASDKIEAPKGNR